MILIEIQYKTYNRELLAIIEAFKTWGHYLKHCKNIILRFSNYNNLQKIIDT